MIDAAPSKLLNQGNMPVSSTGSSGTFEKRERTPFNLRRNFLPTRTMNGRFGLRRIAETVSVGAFTVGLPVGGGPIVRGKRS